jgi:hypothetical protein
MMTYRTWIDDLSHYLGTEQKYVTIVASLGDWKPSEFTRDENVADSFVTGTIPTELGGLANLEEMYFEQNAWSGSLPTQIGLMSDLQILDLSNSGMGGQLPSELRLLSNCKTIALGISNFRDSTNTNTFTA